MIATARIVMPKAMVRLSAGRVRFSQPEQVQTLFSQRSRKNEFLYGGHLNCKYVIHLVDALQIRHLQAVTAKPWALFTKNCEDYHKIIVHCSLEL